MRQGKGEINHRIRIRVRAWAFVSYKLQDKKYKGFPYKSLFTEKPELAT